MNAKQFFLTSAACLLIAVPACAQRIKGSDTVLPIAQQTAEAYMASQPDARVTVTGGGTGVGISALLDGTTDIAMASRAIKFSETMKAKAAGEDLLEVVIAYDALAVVVHPSNPVSQGVVGNDDYSRETSSGTYEFFKESVLKNKNYMSSSLSMPATGAIIQSVSQTKGAIGYVGLAYISPRVKTMAVSYDNEHYAQPSLENALNKSYPIVRPLYYYYNKKNARTVEGLLQFVLSDEGQEIIKKSGYIPVK